MTPSWSKLQLAMPAFLPAYLGPPPRDLDRELAL
jgi:hypothetical protein